MANLRRKNLAEYCVTLWLRKWLLFLVTGIVSTAGWLVIRKIPDFYESSATVVVFGTQADDSKALGAQITTAVQQLTSRSRLEALIQHHRLYPEMEDIESAVARLQKQIKVETKIRDYYPQSPDYLSIKYRYSDPILVQRVLMDLLSVLDETNELVRQQALTEASRLSLELEKVEIQLQQLGEQRQVFDRQLRASREVGNDFTGPAAANPAEVQVLGDKEYALEQQIAEQKHQIEEQEGIVSSLRNPGVRSDSAYGVLLVRKAETDAMIKDLASQYTDKNTKLVQARAQLVEINRQLEKLEASDKSDGNAKAASPEGRELRGLQRELARLETELQLTRRELSRKTQALTNLPKVQVGSGGISLQTSAEYDRLIRRHSWLLERQDLLKRVSSIPPFRNIDPPHLPQLPVAPNRLLLMILVLISALGAGLLVVVAVEWPRVSLVHDERDVEYYLGVPVIGLIPETCTPVERSLAWRQRLMRRAALVALGAASVPLLAAVLSRLRVLHILAER